MSGGIAVIGEVPLDGGADEVEVLSCGMQSGALVLKWRVGRDTVSYVGVMSTSSTTTGRSVLRRVASLCGPLG